MSRIRSEKPGEQPEPPRPSPGGATKGEPAPEPASFDEVAPLPDGEPHRRDYDDEIPFQRRQRRLVQVAIVPFFIAMCWAGTFLTAGLLARFIERPQLLKDPASYLSLVVFFLEGLFLRAAWLGKIGFQRRWLTLGFLLTLGALGAYHGWGDLTDSAPPYRR